MKDKYNINNKIFSLIKFNFTLCPRYKRKIFKDQQIKKRFEELTLEICKANNVEVVSIKYGPEYVNLKVISKNSKLSPADIMAKVKGGTSRVLRREFESLGHQVSLWTREYLITTEDTIDEEVFDNFIKAQKSRG